MPRSLYLSLALLTFVAAPAAADVAVDLRGSPGSMVRQHRVAKANDFTFLRTGSQVKDFVAKGFLTPVEGNENYRVLPSVSYPYARPELLTFIERLSAQHLEACGEKLVVTSLTRPTSDQPRNSHNLSVHPAGMAVDLRVLNNADCRAWLESTLIALEQGGLLDVTRERRPPHYHIAVFPDAYREYVTPLIARDSALAEAARLAAEKANRDAAIVQLATRSSAMISPGGEAGHGPVGLGDITALAAVPLVLGALAIGARRKNRA